MDYICSSSSSRVLREVWSCVVHERVQEREDKIGMSPFIGPIFERDKAAPRTDANFFSTLMSLSRFSPSSFLHTPTYTLFFSAPSFLRPRPLPPLAYGESGRGAQHDGGKVQQVSRPRYRHPSLSHTCCCRHHFGFCFLERCLVGRRGWTYPHANIRRTRIAPCFDRRLVLGSLPG